MTGEAQTGFDYLSLLVWGAIGLVWLFLTFLALRAQLRGSARGFGPAAGLWLLSAGLSAVAAAPLWFLGALLLIAMGTSNDPQAGMGAGSFIIGTAIFGGLLTGITLASICAVRGKQDPGQHPRGLA